MKDLTEKRQGVWYARKCMYPGTMFNRSTGKNDLIVISKGEVVIFLKDDPFHMDHHQLFIRNSVYSIFRMNQARWSKKFER